MIDIDLLNKTLALASFEACLSTQNYLGKYGDNDACGFSWVLIRGVKLSSKEGKALKQFGFSSAYGGGIQLWNPSRAGCQSISALEAGSKAFVKVMSDAFPDMNIYACSRMD